MKYYSIAVKLDPKEKTFTKALEKCAQRYGITKGGAVNADGHAVMEGKNANKFDKVASLPYYKAWKQFRNETDGIPVTDLAYMRWCHEQNGKPFPTSQQYFVFGMQEWVRGMERGVAYLVLSTMPEAQAQLQALKAMAARTGMDPIELRARTKELFGGDEPNGVHGDPFQELSNGFAYLEGRNLHLETGGQNSDVPKDDMLVPPPDVLSSVVPFQHLSILGSIVSPLQFLSQELGGRKMKSSQALLEAAKNLFANLRFDGNDKLGVGATPEEAVDFIETQLQAGKTWNGVLRRYVSLQYRGTILYGAILRFTGMVAECHKYESWAKEFIELADAKFHVTEEQAYNEKGNTFRPSIRIGFMVSMLHTHMALGGGRLDGAYPMSESIELCLEVIKLAEQFESSSSTEVRNEDFLRQFQRLLMDYSCRRKPLAVAKSCIGHMLTNIWNACGSANDFWHVALHHGFVDSSSTSCDPYAIIAEFYHGAAAAEIPDAAECAIFWWSYAANMAQANESSGFTMGKLRTAIKRAEEAEKARDVALFGLNPQLGGTCETVARVAQRHFVDKSESFILPEIRVAEGKVFVGDEVICDDFERASKAELASFSSEPKGDDSWMDTADLEKEHGQVNEGIPDLQTLCIRELHRAGCEFAEGESDPAVIHLNAIMAWQQKEKERV